LNSQAKLSIGLLRDRNLPWSFQFHHWAAWAAERIFCLTISLKFPLYAQKSYQFTDEKDLNIIKKF
jgi:hypothetical protein